jgi:SAM-dependent methyltransferase
MQIEQFQLHADLEDAHWWFAGRRRILRDLSRALLPSTSGATVVDVGCGTGANAAALAADHDCVGIDPSPEAIALARRRFPGVRFVCGEAPEDLGDVMERSDLVVLMDVLEHVRDDFAFFSRLLAATSPGAHFLVTVPANPALWSVHDESNGHYRRYDPGRFRRLWAGLPVAARLLSPYNARLYPVAGALRRLGRLSGRARGRAGTDVSLPIRPVNAALRSAFAGEARVLIDLLQGRRDRGFAAGLSLIAVLRREAGPVDVRGRPDDVTPDAYDPFAARRRDGGRGRTIRVNRGGSSDVAGHHRRPVL